MRYATPLNICLAMLALILFAILASTRSEIDSKDSCLRRGGEPVSLTSGTLCLAPGTLR